MPAKIIRPQLPCRCGRPGARVYNADDLCWRCQYASDRANSQVAALRELAIQLAFQSAKFAYTN
jgi:hypothetical protein